MSSSMVGRNAELAELVAIVRSARACLVGETGMGKSLLVSEVARACSAAGDVVVHIRGTESGRAIPWGALRSSSLAPWLPEDVDEVARLADALESHIAPDVLIVDEAQSVDRATSMWLTHLVHATTLPMLLAWRAGSQVDPVLLDHLAEGGARTLQLGGLHESDVRLLAERELGPAADSLIRALVRTTGGNPMLVGTAVAQWRREGLVATDGVARLVAEPTAPRPLAEAAAATVAGLPDPERDALLAVSLSEPIELDTLARIVEESVLESCEGLRLISVETRPGGDLVVAGHPTLAHAARSATDPDQRARVAAALLGVSDDRMPVVQRGQWLMLAGQHAKVSDAEAAGTLTQGAEEARRFQDLDLAGQMADAALERGAEVRARLVHAEIAMSSGRWEDANAALAQMATSTQQDEERVLVANAHAYVLGQLGRPEEASDVVRAAMESVGAEHRAPLQVRVAINLLFEADAVGALEMAVPLLEHVDPGIRARACYAAAIAHALQGDGDAAARAADVGERAFTGLVPAPAVTQIGPALAGILAGDLAEARTRARRLLDQMLEAEDREGEATGAFLLGRIALEEADAVDAVRQFRASLAAATQIGDPVAQRWARGGLLHALTLAGQARDPQAQELALGLAGQDATVALFEDDVVTRARAVHAACTGDPAGAIALLSAAAAAARDRRRAVCALLTLEATLLTGPDAARDHALRPAGDWRPAARPTAHQVSTALAAGSLSELEQSWSLAHGAGAELVAAGVAARVGELLPVGSREASLWRGRAAPVVALQPSGTPLMGRLSPRQREVADRAAAGLTSAEIAAELGLSVRTAENHLHQAYRALGVRTRSELRTALGS